MLPSLDARLLSPAAAAGAARALALRPSHALASSPALAALPAVAGGRSAGRRLHTAPAASQQAADLAKQPRCAAGSAGLQSVGLLPVASVKARATHSCGIHRRCTPAGTTRTLQPPETTRCFGPTWWVGAACEGLGREHRAGSRVGRAPGRCLGHAWLPRCLAAACRPGPRPPTCWPAPRSRPLQRHRHSAPQERRAVLLAARHR